MIENGVGYLILVIIIAMVWNKFYHHW